MEDHELMEVATPNPFGGQTRALAVSSAARAEEQRAIAEVQAALVVAKANPRNEADACQRILNACQRQTLAESAVYSYSRGGSDITGPSIRLAEAIAQQWGNLQFGLRELDQANGVSTVQAYAWDVETNTRREVTFQVKHERHTKAGSKRLTDPRDIYETVANQGARRVRACVLAVIPGDVVESAVKECEKTLRAKADTTPEGIAKIVQSFAQWGVTKQQLEARIQRRIDAIQPAQIVALKKVYVSLRDGMSSVEDWFAVESKVGVSNEAAAPDAPPPQASVSESAGYGNADPEPAPAKKQRKPKAEPAPAREPEPAPPARVAGAEQDHDEMDARPDVPLDAEAQQHDTEAAEQDAAAKAGPTAAQSAIPLVDDTPLLLPFDAAETAERKGTLRYTGNDADAPFWQWDGTRWLRFADDEAAYEWTHKTMQKRVTQHCKRARMERPQALAWARDTLKLGKPVEQFAQLRLDQLVELARSIDNPASS